MPLPFKRPAAREKGKFTIPNLLAYVTFYQNDIYLRWEVDGPCSMSVSGLPGWKVLEFLEYLIEREEFPYTIPGRHHFGGLPHE